MISAADRLFKDRRISLALAFLVNAALGSVYSYGVFRPALEKHWALNASESGLPYMLFLAVFAFSMPFGGALIARFGEKKTIWLGALLLGAGWVLAGGAADINSLALSYGLLGGAGVGVAYGAPLSLAAKLYPDRKGFAMGAVLAGFGLSPVFSAPLIREAIELAGPVRAFAWSGAVLAGAIAFFSLFLRRPPAHPHAHTARGMATLPEHDLGSREMLCTPVFYALWLSFAAACAIGLSVIGMTSSFAIEVVGIEPAGTTAILMIFSAFNALGRPVFGYLSDRFGPGAAGAASFALVACAAAALALLPPARWTFAAAFALLWFNLGAWLAVAPTATASFFGLTNQPRNYGIVYTAYGAGAIAGVSLASWIKEMTGSYSSVPGPMAAAALLMALFSYFSLRKGPGHMRRAHVHFTRSERKSGRT
ncbi:MAG: oxalate/formate antiporter [Elusimicrobia bacterium]|nr:MAG: oxalate/formate antiporter [Elusimicrobiota bacterium]KAF0152235.1 MAG: oxalate/formate antiporter [Elusimicrobiota bacterium]